MLLRSGHSEVRMSEVCETVAKQCDCGRIYRLFTVTVNSCAGQIVKVYSASLNTKYGGK